jgi:hypothetical protein
MPRLKNRQQQIPNGFRFGLPEANWKAQPFQSFDSIVNSVAAITNANPALSAKHGWPTDRGQIADWIDEFNAQICAQNNWVQYINQGGEAYPPPKSKPLSVAKNVAAGAKTLASWIGSGAHPVSKQQAEQRALVCSKCPLNEPGDFSNFFTRATSELLRMQVQTAQDLDLTTPHDSKLGVCKACDCPMRLKVWTPLEPILEHLLPEAKAALDKNCWIIAEELASHLESQLSKT